MHYFRSRGTEIFEQIARVRGQAAAMRVHVADRNFARDPRIEHHECWIEPTEFRVPGNFFFTDQLGNYRRADRFRQRRELKDGVRIYRHFCARIANTKSFRVHRLVLKDDRNGEPRQRILLNLFLRKFFKFLNSSGYLFRSDARFFLRHCAKRRRQNQRQAFSQNRTSGLHIDLLLCAV